MIMKRKRAALLFVAVAVAATVNTCKYLSIIGGSGTSNTIIGGNNDTLASYSPACNPHFKLALPNNQWSSTVKFKRIYFYHARKAGGTYMANYFKRMAAHYGLEFKAVEWYAMEEPGTSFNDTETFYVTHMREPVDRSISAFKYEGRWDCRDLIKHYNRNFTPTAENANSFETWNQTGGHVPNKCTLKKSIPRFHLNQCAVNCYSQWFSGLSCPQHEIPITQQYQVAKSRVMKYNFIIIMEKLSDKSYVKAIEDFFGFTGLLNKNIFFCDPESKEANKKFPLTIRNDTLERLTRLNRVDSQLYRDISGCLDDGQYNFLKWDPNRFDLHSSVDVKAP